MKRMVLLLTLAALMMAGCTLDDEPQVGKAGPVKGTLIWYGENWTNSDSLLERELASSIYVRYEQDGWHVLYLKGTNYTPFWKSDSGYEDLDRVADAFGLSVAWQFQKALHDELAALNEKDDIEVENKTEPPEGYITEPPEGYIIVTDGERYTWKKVRDGYISVYDSATKEDAIAAAWRYVNYRSMEDKSNWRDAE